jgi:hypothetical protein
VAVLAVRVKRAMGPGAQQAVQVLALVRVNVTKSFRVPMVVLAAVIRRPLATVPVGLVVSVASASTRVNQTPNAGHDSKERWTNPLVVSMRFWRKSSGKFRQLVVTRKVSAAVVVAGVVVSVSAHRDPAA